MKTAALAASIFVFACALPSTPGAASRVHILCLNKHGTRYVERSHPSKCAVFGRGGSFAGGVNMRKLKWHRWGKATARARGREDGFHLPRANIPIKLKAYRIVKGRCGRVYSRLKSTSKLGTTVVKLRRCPGRA